MKKLAMTAAVSAIGIFGFCGAANADLLTAGIFKNLDHEQTGSGVVATDVFFNALAEENAVGDFDSASVSVNGGAPINMPLSGTTFGIGPAFSNQAAMDAAFPFGTYVISATGTHGTRTETVNYSMDAYTQDIPALTAASYNALQGLSVGSSPLTLDFNSFTPNPNANAAFTFVSISNSNQGCNALSFTATSCTIHPSALTAGTTYDYEVDFSDRIEQIGLDGVLTYTDFDVRTDGTFTTAAAAVPEPLTLSLFGAGLVGAFAARRRKKA